MDTPSPCANSPCGANAICKERNGVGSCACSPEYFGDPYTGCRPECVQNSECDQTRACINNKCVDPCPGVCPTNASKLRMANLLTFATRQSFKNLRESHATFLPVFNLVCTVRNHAPNCFCDNGFTGNPSISCSRIEISKCPHFEFNIEINRFLH